MVLASEEAKFTSSFFKWTKHFKNYHPDITHDIFQLQGYHPICYQTKHVTSGSEDYPYFVSKSTRF